jgi:hypothetical protein
MDETGLAKVQVLEKRQGRRTGRKKRSKLE